MHLENAQFKVRVQLSTLSFSILIPVTSPLLYSVYNNTISVPFWLGSLIFLYQISITEGLGSRICDPWHFTNQEWAQGVDPNRPQQAAVRVVHWATLSCPLPWHQAMISLVELLLQVRCNVWHPLQIHSSHNLTLQRITAHHSAHSKLFSHQSHSSSLTCSTISIQRTLWRRLVYSLVRHQKTRSLLSSFTVSKSVTDSSSLKTVMKVNI
jgi:hypothetical protein